MSNNKDFVGNLANELAKKGSTMNQRQVSSALNASGRKTTYGTDYQGGRGTNKLVSTSYDYFDNKGDKETAKNIAERITNSEGETPWTS